MTVIHVKNWHWVPKPQFALDLLDQEPGLTSDEIDRRYAQLLDDVERIQLEQVELLRQLTVKHGVKAVFYEGVTDDNLPTVRTTNDRLRRLERLQTNRHGGGIDQKIAFLSGELRDEFLQLGAIGRLIRAGELEDFLALEDSRSLDAADPVGPDGAVHFDPVANERREDDMARRLVKGGRVVIVVLGGEHDLGDNLQRLEPSVEYIRLDTPKYRELEEQ
jgi:hypothetical protein